MKAWKINADVSDSGTAWNGPVSRPMSSKPFKDQENVEEMQT